MNVKKTILRYLITLLAMIAAGYLLLVAVYALPTGRIAAHVEASSAQLPSEVNWPQLSDQFTDSIMLNISAYEKTKSVWVEALEANRLSSDGLTPYPRYWHGYLLFTKPLLLLFNYRQIRQIFIFVHLALLFAILYLLGKRERDRAFLPLLFAVYLLNPVGCAMSLAYTPMYVLTLLELVVILLLEGQYRAHRSLWFYHFFIVGCLTAYFDFLTFPAVSLGVSLVFLLSQYETDWKKGFLSLLGSGGLWVAGYGAMWAGKWLLATLFTDADVFADAFGTIAFRVGREYNGASITALDAIGRNLQDHKLELAIVCLFFVVCLAVGLIKKRARPEAGLLPVLATGLIPFVWFAVLANHSYIHYGFTYREIAISAYALAAIGVMLAQKKPKPGGIDSIPQNEVQ